VFFQGIDKAATLQVKTRRYMENQLEVVNQGSGPAQAALRPFLHPSPIYDFAAVECAAIVAQTSPHAYPASDNDFGTVMGKIWNTIKSVGSHVVNALDIAGGMGLPFAGPIAQIGKGLMAL
jgi:hypothetical protein